MGREGQLLGKYRLVERLGQGGMAQVYRARQPVIERDVAIKVLHGHLAAQDGFVERFKREARGLGQLRHPHIVSVIDFDTVDDTHYLVMDFVAGPTLADWLKSHGPLPVDQAILIAAQIADALSFAHTQGAIHRDVKPGNIMFLDKSPTHAVLTDFGIAQLLDDVALTLSGTLAGTPAYMSPEAAEGGQSDARSDLYSLGVVLYEMVTGVTPYQADTPVRMMVQHMTAPLPSLRETHPALPEIVVQVIERALTKHPADRFPSAAAMHQALLQAQLALNEGHAPPTQLIAAQTLFANEQSLAAAPPARRAAQPANATPAPPDPTAPPNITAPSAAGPHSLASSLRLLGVALGSVLVVTMLWLTFGDLPTAANEAPVSARQSNGAEAGRVAIVPHDGGQDLIISATLAPPPEGHHYHAWLRARDGVLFDLGSLTVRADAVHHVVSAPYNFLALVDAALITLEGAPDPVAPSPQIELYGQMAPHLGDALAQLLVASSLPLGKPLLPGVREQITIAQEHTGMLADALRADDLSEAQRHAEHVVNILDGESGSNFGDLNLDGQAQNPGDGVGVRVYLVAAVAAQGGDQATLVAVLGNTLAATEAMIVAARQVSAADSLAEAQTAAEQLALHLHQFFNGADQGGRTADDAIQSDASEDGFERVIELVSALAVVPLWSHEHQPN
jgi:serine/threonine protein kinase